MGQDEEQGESDLSKKEEAMTLDTVRLAFPKLWSEDGDTDTTSAESTTNERVQLTANGTRFLSENLVLQIAFLHVLYSL